MLLLQVDNQLFGSCKPVLLYVMPTSPQRESPADTKPALTLAIHRIPSRNWNANVFKVSFAVFMQFRLTRDLFVSIV